MQDPIELQVMQEQDAALDEPVDDRPFGEEQPIIDYMETRYDDGMGIEWYDTPFFDGPDEEVM